MLANSSDRVRSFDIGISGTATRASITANARRSARPPRIGTSVPGAPQPALTDSCTPNAKAISPAVNVTAPPGSLRDPVARGSSAGTQASAAVTSAAPAGTLRRTPKPLTRPSGNKHAERARQASDQRSQREHANPSDEDPPRTGQVPGTTTEQQKPSDEHAVGDDDPLQVIGGHVKVRLDRRERDIDHREVDHRHRHDTAHDGKSRVLGIPGHTR